MEPQVSDGGGVDIRRTHFPLSSSVHDQRVAGVNLVTHGANLRPFHLPATQAEGRYTMTNLMQSFTKFAE